MTHALTITHWRACTWTRRGGWSEPPRREFVGREGGRGWVFSLKYHLSA